MIGLQTEGMPTAREIARIVVESRGHGRYDAKACARWIDRYAWIEDAHKQQWFKMKLWPAQYRFLTVALDRNTQELWGLKARQMGWTWIILLAIGWRMLCFDNETGLVYSAREKDARMLVNRRLREVYNRLPEWMRPAYGRGDSTEQIVLTNGGYLKAMPGNRGDSYQVSHILVDEADVEGQDLNKILAANRPVWVDGGQGWIISKANKKKPNSRFKREYKAARTGEHPRRIAHFSPWYERPTRTREWYDLERATATDLDEFLENLPETEDDALARSQTGTFFDGKWLVRIFEEGLELDHLLAIPNLKMYKRPEPGKQYIIGADPAEGQPDSHDSAATVINRITGEQVAELSGKFTPRMLAQYIGILSRHYNRAAVLVERGNHGHAVIVRLEDMIHDPVDPIDVPVIYATDDRKGYITSGQSKLNAYNHAASWIAAEKDLKLLRGHKTKFQLENIVLETLLSLIHI